MENKGTCNNIEITENSQLETNNIEKCLQYSQKKLIDLYAYLKQLYLQLDQNSKEENRRKIIFDIITTQKQISQLTEIKPTLEVEKGHLVKLSPGGDDGDVLGIVKSKKVKI